MPEPDTGTAERVRIAAADDRALTTAAVAGTESMPADGDAVAAAESAQGTRSCCSVSIV